MNFIITGGSGTDTITSGGGNDVIRGGAGGDVVNIGAGIDQYIVAADETSIAATGNDDAGDTLGATDVWTWTTGGGFDKITGFGVGDTIQFFTTGTTAITTQNAIVTAAGTVAAANLGGVLAQRGNQTNTTTFTGAADGADTILLFDADGTGAGTAYVGIILVGYTGLANDTISTAGLFTAV
jgi:hypothetical protein